MQIIYKSCGDYQTNCYIVSDEHNSLIIDPGQGALDWVKNYAQKPLAILNTHGHFDHVFNNASVKKHFDIPIYIPKDDEFMLSGEQFGMSFEASDADVLVHDKESFSLGAFNFEYLHFPGHSPGNSMIVFDTFIISGDFIFDGSIGRVDLPFCSKEAMKDSIKKFLAKYDTNDETVLYPGHGGSTSIAQAHRFLPMFLSMSL